METTLSASGYEEKIKTLEAVARSQSAQIAEMRLLLKFYEEQFRLAQRQRFGASSQQSPDQLRFENIFNEAEDQANPQLPEPAFEQITYKRKKRTGKRRDDLSGLPLERVDHELPESERICPECGGPMHDMGGRPRDELEIIPAKVIHKQHVVHAYECRNCKKNSDHTPIIKASAPAPLISGSLASPSAVAHIAAQKYVNGMPLYRQEKELAYDGVALSRQTMANWLIYCAENYLSAVYSLMKASLLKEEVLHADETPVQVLHEPGRAAQSKSYEWLYRTSGCSRQPVVIYEYQQTRGHEHPELFLKDFRGWLHTDGWQAYHKLPEGITVAGCWFHARQYWENLYKTLPENQRGGSNAERGLVYINLLFAFEDEFRELTADDRYNKRLEFSKPVSDEFFAWAGSLNPLPKSLIGKAVHYAFSQREYLENVYRDGRLEFSNNRAERSIKPFVQGRKQWLFSAAPAGAEASSVIYSIIETAKENHLHPYQYLKFLLETLPNAKSSDLQALLPWSPQLPGCCRAPEQAVKRKPEKKRSKGPLNQALARLRERFSKPQGSDA